MSVAFDRGQSVNYLEEFGVFWTDEERQEAKIEQLKATLRRMQK